jgi:hypothetical protein
MPKVMIDSNRGTDVMLSVRTAFLGFGISEMHQLNRLSNEGIMGDES